LIILHKYIRTLIEHKISAASITIKSLYAKHKKISQKKKKVGLTLLIFIKDNINIMKLPAASSGISCWIIISSSSQAVGNYTQKEVVSQFE